MRQCQAHSDEVRSLILTKDGRLISAGHDGLLKVFDPNGLELFQADLKAPLRYVPHILHASTWPGCLMLLL